MFPFDDVIMVDQQCDNKALASADTLTNKFGYRKSTALTVEGSHYNDVILDSKASEITSLTIVYSAVYLGADKKTSKLRVTGLCAENSPVTGEFPAQRAINAENVSIWCFHHVVYNDRHLSNLFYTIQNKFRMHDNLRQWFPVFQLDIIYNETFFWPIHFCCPKKLFHFAPTDCICSANVYFRQVLYFQRTL